MGVVVIVKNIHKQQSNESAADSLDPTAGTTSGRTADTPQLAYMHMSRALSIQ